MRTHDHNGATGFSLVELMVAMTVTLIVSGAIYGLLASGGNAFRREPEVADRQQNIRMAMDLITRDVFNAGAAVGPFGQMFSRTDPAGGSCTGAQGMNGCGVLAGSLGAPAAALRAPGDGGDPSTNTDVLELVAADENCGTLTVCSQLPVPGGAGRFVTRESMPACMQNPGFALLSDSNTPPNFLLQPFAIPGGAPQACPNGGNAAFNANFQLGASVLPWLGAPAPVAVPSLNAPPSTPVVFFYRARVVRYAIANNPDPLDPSPALWRSETGRFSTAGALQPEPGGGGFPGAASPWQLVARGIEDLQVEYMAGDFVWRNQPALVVPPPGGGYPTLVRMVRITLSARALAPNLGGQTLTAGAGGAAVRGQLVTVITPRAAFDELQMGSQIR